MYCYQLRYYSLEANCLVSVFRFHLWYNIILSRFTQVEIW